MPSTPTFRRLLIAGVWFGLNLWPPSMVLAEGPSPPTVAIPSPESSGRVLAPSRSKKPNSPGDSSGGWWLGSVGIAAALVVFGGISVASKRFLPTRDSASIQVVGRSSLSTKHSVYLIRVGDRVLIVGAGPQGAPSTLGEVTDPVELSRLLPRQRNPRPLAGTPVVPTRFDQRIGDDE